MTTGIRRSARRKFLAGRCRRPSCWEFHWCWAAPPAAATSPCATLCPHRGIPLSYGWFDGQQVTCKYHGWGFEPVSGQCREIPSLTERDSLDPCRIYATAFPCEERDGHVWVYVPQSGRGNISRPSAKEGEKSRSLDSPRSLGMTERGTRHAGESQLPPVPEVPKFGARFRTAHLTADLPCNVDHGIIGLMDPAHGPFVHQSWWWRSRASIHEKEKHFEPIESGFRMTAHQPSANSAPVQAAGGLRRAHHHHHRFRAAQSPL